MIVCRTHNDGPRASSPPRRKRQGMCLQANPHRRQAPSLPPTQAPWASCGRGHRPRPPQGRRPAAVPSRCRARGRRGRRPARRRGCAGPPRHRTPRNPAPVRQRHRRRRAAGAPGLPRQLPRPREGVDIRGERGVEAVCFADTRTSQVEIVQNIGRALDCGGGSKPGIPCCGLWYSGHASSARDCLRRGSHGAGPPRDHPRSQGAPDATISSMTLDGTILTGAGSTLRGNAESPHCAARRFLRDELHLWEGRVRAVEQMSAAVSQV